MIALIAAALLLGSSGSPALDETSGAGSASGSPGPGAGLAPDVRSLEFDPAVPVAPEPDASGSGTSRGPSLESQGPGPRLEPSGLEALVPGVAGHTFTLTPGPRVYGQRLSFTPAFGNLGAGDLYLARLAYNPSSWLGYEAAIGHNPGRSVHALTHMLSALLRYPIPFRIQPYATVGYGMVMVFPGQSVNADPVTENVFAAGGGLELFVRDDVALRMEGRRLFVPGDDPAGGTAVYEYGEVTFGLSFYRGISN